MERAELKERIRDLGAIAVDNLLDALQDVKRAGCGDITVSELLAAGEEVTAEAIAVFDVYLEAKERYGKELERI